MKLQNRKILLGICGSIAAYKSALLARLFIKEGAEVKVIMTKDALNFISALTLQTLSKNLVLTDLVSESEWNNHVEMGMWADVFVIAPISANSIAKLANGICDNMLSATYLSSRCPVVIAPAMDLDMWEHPATKRNLKTLSDDGVTILPVGEGDLASGLVGKGRMSEPEDIFNFIVDILTINHTLKNKKIAITAGPTIEKIDPVRFIGNSSSGKMGLAIAESFQKRGADVTLIYGPGTADPAKIPNVVRVQTALQMKEALENIYEQCDIVVFSAAVADYRPESFSPEKIKKSHGDTIQLKLIKNPDIAADFGKKKKCIHVGFALESSNGVENALRKLKDKNFDMIILNDANDPSIGIQSDQNQITILRKDGSAKEFPKMQKKILSDHIVSEIISLIQSEGSFKNDQLD